MTTPVRSVPPTDGSTGAAWAGEKRRKTVAPPSPPLGLGSSSSDDESVFSAQDDIDGEEVSRCYEQLRKREGFLFMMRRTTTRMGDEGIEEAYKRLCELRYRDCKILVGDDGLQVPLLSMYPTDEGCPWDNTFEPGPSIFGWTYDPRVIHVDGLDDYQRIIPTIVDLDEYRHWDDYCLTRSDYKTDQEYVKYCDEMSEKIKWVEEYMRQNNKEFEDKFEPISRNQALKIAIGFPHLTFTLAHRGFDEFVLALAYKLETKDYVRVYFEVWERVCCKQEMSFEDALKSALPAFDSCNDMIRGQLLGYHNLVLDEFKTCIGQVPSHVTDKDEVLKHITDAVYKIKSASRPKLYLDFVKKKIEVAQRLQLYPDEGKFCIGKV